MYLFSEHFYPDENVLFDVDDGYNGLCPTSFNYDGRQYDIGNYYNGIRFSRDLIYWIYENRYLNEEIWATANDWTFESSNRSYASAQFISAQTLRDLALDAEMAKRSDMIFHLLTLINHMDTSAKHWGGSASARDYIQYGVRDNKPSDMAWALFDKGRPELDSWFDSVPFMSPKPFSELFLDIGRLSNKPDDYYYINIERNGGHDYYYYDDIKNSAKWTYCTKFFNLGGSPIQWVLALRTPDNWYRWGGHSTHPFRIWINNASPDPPDQHAVQDVMGKNNIQYKNAMLILAREELQIYGDLWNHKDKNPDYFYTAQEGNWQYYKFRTAESLDPNGYGTWVWVAIATNRGALEVAIEGVDYQTFADFKWAMNNVAEVGGDYFVTSKGDRISTDGHGNYGLVNGKPIWGEYGFPVPTFPLITTIDSAGRKIIDWDWESLTMILDNGTSRQVFDFKNWVMEDSASLRAPSNLKIERRSSH
jgi:hypothetical protein